MSRSNNSRKGTKHTKRGRDLWSKRPLAGASYGPVAKEMSKWIERRRAKNPVTRGEYKYDWVAE